MKALLLALMFLISMTAFCQQKSSREDGATVLKDRSIIVTKDSLMSSQSIIIDHHALAKKYKSKSTYYGIAAAVFGVACFGFYQYSLTHFVLIGPIGSSNSKSDNAAIIGTVCLGAAIGCTIAAIVYHHKAGKELKLSIKGTSASLVYTF